jgi:hypothetical protein
MAKTTFYRKNQYVGVTKRNAIVSHQNFIPAQESDNFGL